jgi:hypothetical protein
VIAKDTCAASKLNCRQEAHLVSVIASSEYSTAEVTGLFAMARSAVSRGHRT